jgi:hypothetical protein
LFSLWQIRHIFISPPSMFHFLPICNLILVMKISEILLTGRGAIIRFTNPLNLHFHIETIFFQMNEHVLIVNIFFNVHLVSVMVSLAFNVRFNQMFKYSASLFTHHDAYNSIFQFSWVIYGSKSSR